MTHSQNWIRWYGEPGSADIALVGGKNSSLGELVANLTASGVAVPDGFAITAAAYREFIVENGLADEIRRLLDEGKRSERPATEVAAAIRRQVLAGSLPADVIAEVRSAYRELSQRYGVAAADVAVRSSATAEDLPDASFAGQHESYLNVVGEDAVLAACRECYASLFTERAISYREAKGFEHMKVALSVGVQKMIRSDLAASGVVFTIDTETGFPDLVLINASWGLGENVVKGRVNPDEFRVFKPLLTQPQFRPIIEKTLGAKELRLVYTPDGVGTQNVETTLDERRKFALGDDQILQLARWACLIEHHYGRPMDIEWAIDGQTQQLFIVQARSETVESRQLTQVLRTFTLQEQGPVLAKGTAIGRAIAVGPAYVLGDISESSRFRDGGVLVARMTDPDWVPVMRRAAAVVTDEGGRTSHAAIVSRELGVPAVVGTSSGTSAIVDATEVTVSCAEGEEGHVYQGRLRFETEDTDLRLIPQTRTKVMMNLANPDAALRWWRLPSDGVGLARMEFIIDQIIKVHPMALVRFEQLKDAALRKQIEELTEGYADKREYFVDKLSRGIAKIAAAHHPHDVIVRTSDFKTNEYANLIGGQAFEPHEENPMLGFRGASRYYSDRYAEGFALECLALKRVREEMGLSNVVVMIPFCRTIEEADQVLRAMERNGLRRGEHGLRVYVMAEIPSNVILADKFAQRFDGFSIGSNDLTQLVLGIDRDSAELASLFDERNEAITRFLKQLLAAAHAGGRSVGICGQAPSDYPEFVDFLVGIGIDSISVNPDSLVEVRRRVAAAEELSLRVASTIAG